MNSDITEKEAEFAKRFGLDRLEIGLARKLVEILSLTQTEQQVVVSVLRKQLDMEEKLSDAEREYEAKKKEVHDWFRYLATKIYFGDK